MGSFFITYKDLVNEITPNNNSLQCHQALNTFLLANLHSIFSPFSIFSIDIDNKNKMMIASITLCRIVVIVYLVDLGRKIIDFNINQMY